MLHTLGVAELSHAIVLLPPGGHFIISLYLRSVAALDGDATDHQCDAIDLASRSDAGLLDATLRPGPWLVFVEARATPDR